RGILAFVPLTVVGPGRLLVTGEAARVRPGDGGCVSHPLAGAAPVPRRQDASGRRPSKSGSGWAQHSYASSEVKPYFTRRSTISWGQIPEPRAVISGALPAS